MYSGNWDLVTKPLSSETFPGGFGNFSGWIRKLARLDSETLLLLLLLLLRDSWEAHFLRKKTRRGIGGLCHA